MKTLTVDVKDNPYPIHIGTDIITRNTFKPYIVGQQVLIVTNDTVAAHYLGACQQALTAWQVDTLILPDGEQYKTIESWQQILGTLLEKQHRRNTTLIALGGGVIGDMTGFAASCYQRGVAFIQIPTTLLAAVDASVGGKTAVNHPLGKNMIGAFHQPRAVIIDLITLKTLSDEEFASGMAEVIKVAMIADATLFESLQAQALKIRCQDPTALSQMIIRACEIKADIVRQDEKETGLRALLNFGHTFGHAIETVAGYGKIKHGLAVAIGMVLATRLAVRANMIEPLALDHLLALCQLYHLPTRVPAALDRSALLAAMRLDKKNVDAGAVRLVLPTKIGQGCVTADYAATLLDECWQ